MARNPFDTRWEVIAGGLATVLVELAGYGRDDRLFAERLLGAFDEMVRGGDYPHLPDGIAFQAEADAVREAQGYLAKLRNELLAELGNAPR